MENMQKLMKGLLIISLLVVIPAFAKIDKSMLEPVLVSNDIFDNELVLINIKTDQMIQLAFEEIPHWPENTAMIMHAAITPDNKFIYLTTISTESSPSRLITLKLKRIDWDNNIVNIKVFKSIKLSEVADPSRYPLVEQVTFEQPIAQWIQPKYIQYHGPAILPNSDFIYFAEMTGDKIRIVDINKGALAKEDPYVKQNVTEQTHGLAFNSSGSIALGTGYFYENSAIDVYKPNKLDGSLEFVESIILGTESEYAANSHYVFWLNESQAVVGTMQFAETSLTPTGSEVIGPSVWIIDVVAHKATKILDPVQTLDGNGVLRSISDIAVAGGKLYLAEEDSLDGTFGDDGFISVFDITNLEDPKLIKRFKPGVEFPADYSVSHGLSLTPDENFLYVSSYVSGYIIKINTHTDEVVHVFGPEQSLNNPHGSFISGRNR